MLFIYKTTALPLHHQCAPTYVCVCVCVCVCVKVSMVYNINHSYFTWDTPTDRNSPHIISIRNGHPVFPPLSCWMTFPSCARVAGNGFTLVTPGKAASRTCSFHVPSTDYKCKLTRRASVHLFAGFACHTAQVNRHGVATIHSQTIHTQTVHRVTTQPDISQP